MAECNQRQSIIKKRVNAEVMKKENEEVAK